MLVKYSILMPYHMRFQQLAATLSSFLRLYHRFDYEVLIGEDYKNMINAKEHRGLCHIVEEYRLHLPSINVIQTGSEECWNPCKAFNDLAREARGEYLIITNPECLHENNILIGLDKAFNYDSEQYVVCACRIPTGQWYQHSIYRSAKVHFCSALAKRTYIRVGGFDEEYIKGVCFEDDDFRNTLILNNVLITERDDLVVMHQNHGKSKPANYGILHARNRSYFNQKWGPKAFRAERLTVEPFQSENG